MIEKKEENKGLTVNETTVKNAGHIPEWYTRFTVNKEIGKLFTSNWHLSCIELETKKR